MSTSDSRSRPYRKRKRARQEEETRRRITEAAVELHGTVGPARTKVTEVAELAGVSRRTVYNHFPTEADLFVACSTQWVSENPFPEAEGWKHIEDPQERLLRALSELYEWYGRNRGMMGNVLRDAAIVPALGKRMGELWEAYVADVVTVLSEGWSLDPKRSAALDAMLRLVVDFCGWRALSESDGGGDRAAEIATEMLVGAVRLTAD